LFKVRAKNVRFYTLLPSVADLDPGKPKGPKMKKNKEETRPDLKSWMSTLEGWRLLLLEL
jgi:hypothetical protein